MIPIISSGKLAVRSSASHALGSVCTACFAATSASGFSPTKSSQTRHFANYAISRTPAQAQATVHCGKATVLGQSQGQQGRLRPPFAFLGHQGFGARPVVRPPRATLPLGCPQRPDAPATLL